MSFEVGDRVVCVDAKPTFRTATGLTHCAVYTVVQFVNVGKYGKPLWGIDGKPFDKSLAVVVAEAKCPGNPFGAYDPRRFRKLRDISQSLKALKEMTVNCPPLVEAER